MDSPQRTLSTRKAREIHGRNDGGKQRLRSCDPANCTGSQDDKQKSRERTGLKAGNYYNAKLLCGGVALAADALDFGHYPESVFAENFADLGFGIAFLQERAGDLREMRDVLHTNGHNRAIEIG